MLLLSSTLAYVVEHDGVGALGVVLAASAAATAAVAFAWGHPVVIVQSNSWSTIQLATVLQGLAQQHFLICLMQGSSRELYYMVTAIHADQRESFNGLKVAEQLQL